MNRATMSRLAELVQELDGQGRTDMAEAVREALNELRPAGLLTTGEAAERLGVALSTVRRWVERGVLDGIDTGTRVLVGADSVDRILRVRQLQREMDEEGYPTAEEIDELTRRVRQQMNAERRGDREGRAAG